MSAIIWGCDSINCVAYGRPVPQDWNTCPQCYGGLTEIEVAQTRSPYGKCCICEKANYLPHETPADPPFYPVEGGRHCDECEDWLTLPGLSLRREKR